MFSTQHIFNCSSTIKIVIINRIMKGRKVHKTRKMKHARKNSHKRTSKRKTRKINRKSYKSRGGQNNNSPMTLELRANAPEFIPAKKSIQMNPNAPNFIPSTTLPQETVFDPAPITLNERAAANEKELSNSLIIGPRLKNFRENRGRMINSLQKQGSKLPSWISRNNSL